MILKSLSTAGNNKIHPPKFLNSAGYRFILVSLQGHAYAQPLRVPVLSRWAGTLEMKSDAESRTSWSSSCSSTNRLLHSETVVDRPATAHTHGQMDTHTQGLQPEAASHIKANFKLLHYWSSPSGRRELVSRVDVHLTSTLAAASLTSAGRSSLQHEHTNAPHWAKQATALKL